jgi:hypothetical protein
LAQFSFQPVRFDVLWDESKKEYSDQRDGGHDDLVPHGCALPYEGSSGGFRI